MDTRDFLHPPAHSCQCCAFCDIMDTKKGLIVMLFENISILADDFTVKHGQYVGIKADKIAYIGSERPT